MSPDLNNVLSAQVVLLETVRNKIVNLTNANTNLIQSFGSVASSAINKASAFNSAFKAVDNVRTITKELKIAEKARTAVESASIAVKKARTAAKSAGLVATNLSITAESLHLNATKKLSLAQYKLFAASKMAEMEDSVNSLVAEMEALQAAYDEAFQSARTSISQQIGLFQELCGAADRSIQDLIGSLQSQMNFMDDYAANLQEAMRLGVDEGLIARLSDGSEESARILAAIVADGGDRHCFVHCQ